MTRRTDRSLPLAVLFGLLMALPMAAQEEANSVTAAPIDELDGLDDDTLPEIGGSLAGRVVLLDPSRREEVTDLTTVSGQETVARITLTDSATGDVVATVLTDADGRFEFPDLEPLRKYHIQAARRGYRNTELETAIALSGPTEITLRMPARKNLWWYFRAGGDLMFLLLAISIVALYVAIERAHFLLVRCRTNTPELLRKVRSRVLERDLKGAAALCARNEGPIGRVLHTGIGRHGSTRSEIDKAMENSAIQQVARLERGLAVLASAAGIAPIIGFLGTVVGMIMAFDAIAEHGLSDPSYVADGISTALISTAGGLTVAVFSLPTYHFFNTRIAIFMREMETSANVLLETFDHLDG